MLKRHKIFTLILLVIAGANIFAESSYVQGLNVLTKPLICVSLAICLLGNVNMKAGFNRLIFTSLILSFFGDYFLLFAGVNASFFVCGLLAFLLAHFFCSLAFFRDFKNDPQASKVYGHIMLFVMGIFSLSYYSWIRDYLHDLRIAVMAYIFIISMMAILAGYRYQRVNLLSFRLVYAGAILLAISGSILIYNKFADPFPFSGTAIISTYILAQYLITMGAIERVVLPGSAKTGD